MNCTIFKTSETDLITGNNNNNNHHQNNNNNNSNNNNNNNNNKNNGNNSSKIESDSDVSKLQIINKTIEYVNITNATNSSVEYNHQNRNINHIFNK